MNKDKVSVRTKAFLILLSTLLVLALACSSKEAPTPTPTSKQPTSTATAVPTPTVAVARPTPQPTPTQAVKVEGPQSGGVIRYALNRGFDNMDPVFISERGFRPVMFAIYNNLVQLMPDGSVAPELARSWEISADGKTVTFKLQPGVKFTDGTPADAQAVKWNIDRFMDSKIASNARRGELVPPLLSVEVVDSQTVRFNLSAAFRPLLLTLTTSSGQMASPTAVQALNSYSERAGDYGKRPVGSGPFIMKAWTPGKEVVLTRNDSYWEKGLPYADSMSLPIVPDVNVIFAMLRTGEVDVMEELPVSSVPLAQANPNLKVVNLAGARVRFMWFRLSKEPWNNKALREALAYAQDRNTLSSVLYMGLGTPAYQALGPSYGVWFDPNFKAYDFNVAKAKDKLAEAGYAKGFSYTQLCASNTFDIQWCETVQAMLANVGIKMDIQAWESSTYFSDFIANKHNGPLLTGLGARVDPHLFLQRYFHTKGGGNGPYGTSYSNPAMDAILDQAATVYDVAKANDLYKQATQMIVNDLPYVFQVQEPKLFGARANVRNFVALPDVEVRLRNLWFAK